MEAHEEEVVDLTHPEGEEATGDPGGDATWLVLATIGILVVTVLAIVAATMAAVASNRESVSNRSRQIWGAYSTKLNLVGDAQNAEQQEWTDTQIQDAWRSYFLGALAAGAQDPSVQAQLSEEAKAASAQAAQPSADYGSSSISVASPGPPSWCSGPDQSDCASEFADSYGISAEGSLRNERAYLAIVSIFAVALFLFALTRSIARPEKPGMQKMFLIVGAVMTAAATGWLILEPFFKAPVQPSAAGIQAYERGSDQVIASRQNFKESELVSGINLLRRSTVDNPKLPDEWTALASALQTDARGQFVRANCAAIEFDDAQAVQLRQSSSDYNNLAYDYALCGNKGAAKADIASALRLDKGNDVALGTRAEMDLTNRNENKALSDLQVAVDAMILGNGHEYRGSIYRDQWFDDIRADEHVLRQVGVPTTMVSDFFDEVRHDQALVDILDAVNLKNGTVPTPKANEGVSNLTVSVGHVINVASLTSSAARFSFSYSNLRAGELLSVSWYATDPATLNAPSEVLVVGQPGAPQPGSGTYTSPSWVYSDGGNYVVDLAVDSLPAAETRIFIPGNGSVRCVAPPTSTQPTVATAGHVRAGTVHLTANPESPSPFRRVGAPASCLF